MSIGDKYYIQSKDPAKRYFTIFLPHDMDVLGKCVLEKFFQLIPSQQSLFETDVVLISDEDTDPLSCQKTKFVDQICLKKQFSDVKECEDQPRKQKQPRLDHNGNHLKLSRSHMNLHSANDVNDEDEVVDSIDPCEKVKPSVRVDLFAEFNNFVELLTYGSTGVLIEDYKCLDRRELVTNIIVDFYLEYLCNEVLPKGISRRVHVFKSYFFSLLTTDANFSGWNSGEQKGIKAQEKRYKRVEEIDSEVNIFDRDFIVFPCHQKEHWFLVIACYPRLNGAVYADDEQPIEDEKERYLKNRLYARPIKASCLIYLDSIRSSTRMTTSMLHIKNFLQSVYEHKYSQEFTLDMVNIHKYAPPCPQQKNNNDCGLFLLEFFEQFFIKSPITDFRKTLDLSDWFDRKIVLNKRETIAEKIKEKMRENGRELTELPKITFKKDHKKTNVNSELSNMSGT